ncbi:MAG: hypothetical protein VX899_16760 [Myxococcota bacterium]|nr:hypothetical protein [Myxococcota bacterium]
MASYTKTTKHKRKIRNKKLGRAAANRREKYGTTPVFPIHTPEADANAPQEAKKSSN